jgi:hypothetical protein
MSAVFRMLQDQGNDMVGAWAGVQRVAAATASALHPELASRLTAAAAGSAATTETTTTTTTTTTTAAGMGRAEPALQLVDGCHAVDAAAGTRCFQIFGIDVLLDQQMNPHLLEVNNMPSKEIGEAVDVAVIAPPLLSLLPSPLASPLSSPLSPSHPAR